jgi:hypothetical protein
MMSRKSAILIYSNKSGICYLSVTVKHRLFFPSSFAYKRTFPDAAANICLQRNSQPITLMQTSFEKQMHIFIHNSKQGQGPTAIFRIEETIDNFHLHIFMIACEKILFYKYTRCYQNKSGNRKYISC